MGIRLRASCPLQWESLALGYPLLIVALNCFSCLFKRLLEANKTHKNFTRENLEHLVVRLFLLNFNIEHISINDQFVLNMRRKCLGKRFEF